MPINILNNILRSARDSSGTLLSTTGLKRCKSECFRNLQSQADLKSQEEENNTALCGKSSSLWRSLKGREEGWRHFGSDQAEHVLNYYKQRWVPNGAENAPTGSTLDGALDTDSLTAGKSLYNHWASTAPNRSRDQAKPQKPLKTMSDLVLSSNYDPFRHQAERMMSAMTRPNDSGEGKQHYLHRLKRPISAPMFWVLDKSPLDLLPISEHDTTSARTKKNQKNNPRVSSKETARPSTDSDDEYCSEKEEDEDVETAIRKRSHHARARTSPTTTAATPMNFSPDDIPLFDVNTLKKKYVFGGRFGGAGNANN